MVKKLGKKVPCSVYLKPAVFEEVEAQRGDVKRNTFLEKIIESKLGA